MKDFTKFGRLAWLGLMACALRAGAVTPEPLQSLFIKNDSGLDKAAHHLLVKDQQQFDKYFGHAAVMWQKKKMPPPDFTKQAVALVVHQGKFYTAYKVQSVTNENSVMVIRYTTTVKQTPATTYACPMILTIPRAGLTSVDFVENGQPAISVKF
jgi:hypothetical protein